MLANLTKVMIYKGKLHAAQHLPRDRHAFARLAVHVRVRLRAVVKPAVGAEHVRLAEGGLVQVRSPPDLKPRVRERAAGALLAGPG